MKCNKLKLICMILLTLILFSLSGCSKKSVTLTDTQIQTINDFKSKFDISHKNDEVKVGMDENGHLNITNMPDLHYGNGGTHLTEEDSYKLLTKEEKEIIGLYKFEKAELIKEGKSLSDKEKKSFGEVKQNQSFIDINADKTFKFSIHVADANDDDAVFDTEGEWEYIGNVLVLKNEIPGHDYLISGVDFLIANDKNKLIYGFNDFNDIDNEYFLYFLKT